MAFSLREYREKNQALIGNRPLAEMADNIWRAQGARLAQQHGYKDRDDFVSQMGWQDEIAEDEIERAESDLLLKQRGRAGDLAAGSGRLAQLAGQTGGQTDALRKWGMEGYAQHTGGRSSAGAQATSGVLGAMYSGGKRALSSVRTFGNILTGDEEEARELAERSGAIPQTPQQKAFHEELAKRVEEHGDDSIWQGIKNVFGATLEEPRGAFHEVAAQAPNSAVIVGSMLTGAKVGALAGSAIPGVGNAVGAIVGGIAGLLAGNVSIEGGFIAQEQVAEGKFDRGEILRQSLAKGGTISAIDMATLGINRYLFGAPGRAARKAVESVFARHGLKAADDAAKLAAMKANKALEKEVVEAGQKALLAATPKGAKSAAVHGAAVGLESLGEGAGEYLGSKAAGIDASFTEAVMEAMMSLPQSGAEALVGKAWAKRDVLKSPGPEIDAVAREVARQGGRPITALTPEVEEALQSQSARDLLKLRQSGQIARLSPLGEHLDRLIIQKLESDRAARVAKAEESRRAEDEKLSKRVSEFGRLAGRGVEIEGAPASPEDKYAISPKGEPLERPTIYQPEGKGGRTALDRLRLELAGRRGRPRERGLGPKPPTIYEPAGKGGRTAMDRLRLDLAGRRGRLKTKDEIELDAHEAATSPTNALPEPTDAQKEAGNYKKGHTRVQGMDITIENPQGSERSGTDPDGKPWSVEMQHHYGYFKRSEGKDGDQIDVIVGSNPESQKAYIVDQVDPKTGEFDEHKTLVGFNSEEEARAGYLANYEEGWQGLGAITEMPIDQFKEWVTQGRQTAPVALGKERQKGRAREEAGKGKLTLYRGSDQKGAWYTPDKAAAEEYAGLHEKGKVEETEVELGKVAEPKDIMEVAEELGLEDARDQALYWLVSPDVYGDADKIIKALKDKGFDAIHLPKGEDFSPSGEEIESYRMLSDLAEPGRAEARKEVIAGLRYDPATNRYGGRQLTRGDILTDPEGNTYRLDRANGFMLTLDEVDSSGKVKGSESVSVDPSDKIRFKELAPTGENAYGPTQKPPIGARETTETPAPAPEAGRTEKTQPAPDLEAGEGDRKTKGPEKPEKAPSKKEVDFSSGGDGIKGEYHGWIAAYDKKTGEKIGYVDYSYYDDETAVKMIEVDPKYQRQGYGTILLEKLQSESDTPIKIQGNYATKEGAALFKKFGETKSQQPPKSAPETPQTPAPTPEVGEGGEVAATAAKRQPAAPETGEKEPWEMTREEFRKFRKERHDRLYEKKRYPYPYSEKTDWEITDAVEHRKAVRQAITEGRPVPPEVLADYPDLKPASEISSTASEISPRSPKDKFISDLTNKGAARVGLVDYKIHQADDGGFYYSKVEDGNRFTKGPGYPARWTRAEAIDRVLEDARWELEAEKTAKEAPLKPGERFSSNASSTIQIIRGWRDQDGTPMVDYAFVKSDGSMGGRRRKSANEFRNLFHREVEFADEKTAATPTPPVEDASTLKAEDATAEDLLAEWDRQVAEMEAEEKQLPQATGSLEDYGLAVTETTTKTGKPVWEVSGNTREHSQAIKAAGGRWYRPRKVWSFYNGDPTQDILDRLPKKEAPEARPAEAAAPREPARQEATAAREKAKETVDHIKNAIDKFKEINKILDEEGVLSAEQVDISKYEKIKPLLQEAWQEILAAGKSAKEFVQIALQSLSPKGRPYFEKFVREEVTVSHETGGLDNRSPGVQGVVESEAGVPAPVRAESDRETVSDQSEGAIRGTETGSAEGVSLRGEGQREQEPGAGSDRRDSAEHGGTDRRGTEGTSPGKPRVPDSGVGPGSPRGQERSGKAQQDVNHVIARGDVIFPSGAETKIRANIAAIKLLRKLQAEERNPSPEEKKILAQYVGWGQFSQKIFNTKFAKIASKHGESPALESFPGWTIEEREKTRREYTKWVKKYGKDLHPDLGGLLTQEEWNSAEISTINAHFTSRPVIEKMWSIARRLGFSGGLVLEPAGGVGHFFGLMPQDMAKNSVLYGIEKDTISGGIFQKLYPQAKVDISPFERSKLVLDNSIDLQITNVPFANIPILDKKHPDYSGWSLHNYYFGRMLTAAKPGGLILAVTTSWTMDAKTNVKMRQYLADKADLLGAIRLPNTAFKEGAGTEVTTDILVLRKKSAMPIKDAGVDFSNTQRLNTEENQQLLADYDKAKAELDRAKAMKLPAQAPAYQKKAKSEAVKFAKEKVDGILAKLQEAYRVNEYFIDHPEMVLGKHSMRGSMHAAETYTVEPTGDLEALLDKVVETFPENVAGEATDVRQMAPEKWADKGDKEGTLTRKDGKIYLVEHGRLVEPVYTTSTGKEVKVTEKAKLKRLSAYLDIRDAVTTLRELMISEEATDKQISAQRAELNRLYDDYVKKYKAFGTTGNAWISLLDGDFGVVDALEIVEKVKDGGKGGKVFKKADIFSKRTQYPFVEPTTANDIEDAVSLSIVYRGGIVPEYIGKLIGQSEIERINAEIVDKGLAFINPETGLLEQRDLYLSGNVKKKLKAAEAAKAAGNKAYEKNIEALKSVIPEDIDIEFVSFRLGSTWIPSECIRDFLDEFLGVQAKLEYVTSDDVSRWRLRPESGWNNTKNRETYGTPDILASSLVEKALNFKRAVIKKQTADRKSTYVDEEASKEANLKMQELDEHFVRWAKTHTKWASELTTIYNDEKNGVVLRKHSEPPIEHYPNASTAITLRPHQKIAVSRALNESVLLAYGVGTGKTYIFITTAMEMRRIGTAKKPLIVVHNQTLDQYRKSFQTLYPGAKVMIPNFRQRSARMRKKTLASIATGDWDAVVLPQSFFDGIANDPAKEIAFVEDRVAEIDAAISEATEEEGANSYTVKDLVKLKERKRQQLQNLLDRRKDETIFFEQMGIDALLIDEVHAYKRSEFFTKMDRVKGIDSGSSQRSTSLILKSEFVRSKTGGKNVITATGTPISNTMAELWTMLRYVRPDLLREYGVSRFDEFAGAFGNIVEGLEETPSGFKEVERFAEYVNGPELLTMFFSGADVRLTKDANLKLPKIKGGAPEAIVSEQSPEQRAFLQGVIAEWRRWENLPGKEKRKNRHVPLVLYGMAKKATIDLRLVDPDFYQFNPKSKLGRTIDNTYRIWKKTKDSKGTQLIFLDNFQDSAKRPKFNAHKDIKTRLIEKGVPANEIVLFGNVTEARAEDVKAKIRSGEIRVVIGTTQKLGIGVDIADKMVAAHHVSVPDRPMDIEQRDGRIIRQTNENEEVSIFHYAAKDTLDSVLFHRLLKKQRFSDQVLSGDIEGRTFADPYSEEQVTFAEFAAASSGEAGKLLFEKNELIAQERKYKIAETAYIRKVSNAKAQVRNLKESIPKDEKSLADAKETSAKLQEMFPDGKLDTVTYKGRTMERSEFLELAAAKLEEFTKEAKELFDGKPMGSVGTEPLTWRKEITAKAADVQIRLEAKPESNYSTFEKPSTKMVIGDLEVSMTTKFDGRLWGYGNFRADQLKARFTRIFNDGLAVGISSPERVGALLKESKESLAEYEKLAKEPFRYTQELSDIRQRIAVIDRELIAISREEGESSEDEQSSVSSRASQVLNVSGEEEQPAAVKGRTPWTPARVKRPVKSAVGLAKKNRVNDVFTLGVHGQEAFSNGEFLDLSEPHYPGFRDSIGEKRNYEFDSIFDRFVAQAEHDIGKPEFVKESEAWDTTLAVFRTPENNAVVLNEDYFNYFESKYGGGTTYHAPKADDGAVVVKHKGEVVGLVMMVRLDKEIRFSQSPVTGRAPRGLPVRRVQMIANNIKKKWQNPADEITVVKSVADIKEEGIRSALNPNMTVKAVFATRGGQRKIYLVAENMDSPRDVTLSIFEEGLGHDGFREAFGSGLPTFLDSVYSRHEGDIAPIAQRYRIDTSTAEGRREAADEWISKSIASESLPRQIWDKIIAAIRAWARKAFPGLGVSVAEARELARRAIERGDRFQDRPRMPKGEMALTEGMPRFRKEPKKSAEGENAVAPVFGENAKDPTSENLDEDGLLNEEDARIDPPSKALMKGLGLFESATDRLRRSGSPMLVKLADRVDKCLDQTEARIGWVNGQLRPLLVENLTRKERKQVQKDFEQYWKHYDNGRRREAAALLKENPKVAPIVEKVKELFDEMGRLNQEVGVQVYDGRMVKQEGAMIGRVETRDGEEVVVDGREVIGPLKDLRKEPGGVTVGGWRLIGKIRKGEFWPRALNPEVQAVLQNPKNDPELWNQLVDALVDEGHIEAPEEAQKYLRNYFSREVANDYFSGIEKARGRKLPEIFYDYSWNAWMRYVNKWSARVSQIEQFGQVTKSGTKDAFERAIDSTLDYSTKRYIAALADRVYNRRPLSPYTHTLNLLNLLATGAQLGNPGTATLNLIGGTTLNVQMFGWKRVVAAYKELLSDWNRVQQEGVELGILGKDMLRILRDTESESFKYFDASPKMTQRLGRFAEFTMKWGGYTGTEQIIRATAMIAARRQLNDALKTWNTKGLDNAKAKKYLAFMSRNGIDAKKLIIENGEGEETAKYLRRMVNIPQGSYKVDMVPIYVDTPEGRFFFKYQKFTTQVTRMFWQNMLRPFVASIKGGEKVYVDGKPLQVGGKDVRVKTFLPLFRYFAAAFLGGTTILAARSMMFGYNDPGADWDEIEEALSNDDTALKWALIFNRAYVSLMSASAFGFFGNYIQFGMDVADRQRVKNPLEPPGLASLDAVAELTMRFYEQGKLTARDVEQIGTKAFAFYRGYKRLGATALSEMGAEAREADLEMARRDINYVREVARRYADLSGIAARRTATGRIGRTPRSPVNQKIHEALVLGDGARARQIVIEALRNEDPRERSKLKASMQASMRARQPILIAGTPSAVEKKNFLIWARENLPKSKHQLILDVSSRYDRAARMAGLRK